MKFTNKDGELRLCDATAGATKYCGVYFTQGDFTFPIGREKVEEILTLNRGNYDASASYHEGPDDVILEPLPISFSFLLEDTSMTNKMVSMISGVTVIQGTTLTSTKGTGPVLIIQHSAVSTTTFADTSKVTWDIEVMWDTSGTDYGWRLAEVYFPPGQQTITEGPDGVVLSANGLWYGGGNTLAAFRGGTQI